MPISWAEADLNDRMLVTMRNNEDDCEKIKERWKEVTDSDASATTLSRRYGCLRVIMTAPEDGDVSFHPQKHPMMCHMTSNVRSSFDRHMTRVD